MGKLISKRYDLHITSAGQRITDEWTLDQVTQFKGVFLTSDRDDLLYHRGTQRIDYDGTELVPENYESKLLMSGLNVAPDQRRKTFERGGGNRILKVIYTDVNHPATAFEPYRVSIYVEYEQS